MYNYKKRKRQATRKTPVVTIVTTFIGVEIRVGGPSMTSRRSCTDLATAPTYNNETHKVIINEPHHYKLNY